MTALGREDPKEKGMIPQSQAVEIYKIMHILITGNEKQNCLRDKGNKRERGREKWSLREVCPKYTISLQENGLKKPQIMTIKKSWSWVTKSSCLPSS